MWSGLGAVGRNNRWSATALLFVTLLGCGRAHHTAATETPSDTGGSPSENVGGASAGAGAEAESGGAAGEAPGAIVTPASNMRRLTAAEYSATATDVLGTSFEPQLAMFSNVVDGFDNNAGANGVDSTLYLRYLETAEALADEVFKSNELRTKYVGCSTVDDLICVGQVVNKFGLHLFRRPLATDEVDVYKKVYVRARQRLLGHDDSLRDVLVALLASAQFVYRVELPPAQPGAQPVAPYDMATRLSYLLWSSAPDDALLDAAAQGQLTTDDQLATTVQRLLSDPRASRLGDNFAGQWLGARDVVAHRLDAKQFPQWSPDLAAAVAGEIGPWFANITQSEQDFAVFFSSRDHFVNQDSSALYGFKFLTGQGLQHQELTGVDRQGVLGLIGVLAQTSQPTRSSPTARGAWVLQNLLCQTVPAPPADHPAFDGADDSIADYLQGLQSRPECAACHNQTDTFGLKLEAYDAIGQYRTAYASGKPIVDGLLELSQSLASVRPVRDCVALKLYTYAFGRSVTDAERPNVAALAAAWQQGPQTVHQLILQLVQSPPFRTRDGGMP